MEAEDLVVAEGEGGSGAAVDCRSSVKYYVYKL